MKGEPCAGLCGVSSHLLLYTNGSSLSPVCAHYRKNLYCLIPGSILQMNLRYFRYKGGNNMGGEITPYQKKIIILSCLSGLWPGIVDKQPAFFEKLGPFILFILHL